MIWKKYPHTAPEGEKIVVKYKKPFPSAPFKIEVEPKQIWAHIEEWCYPEELEEFNERKIKEKLK